MEATASVLRYPSKRIYKPQRLDVSGQRFGRLYVISSCGTDIHRNTLWNVRCDCGVEKIVRGRLLVRSENTSCGCWRRTVRSENRKARAQEILRIGKKICGNKKCQQDNPQTLNQFWANTKFLDGKCKWCIACEKDYRLRRNVGATAKEKQRLIDLQNGRCANPGCRIDLSTIKRVAMDHCHETGRLRGVLCSNCNTALGLLKESDSRILGLLDYLTLYKVV